MSRLVFSVEQPFGRYGYTNQQLGVGWGFFRWPGAPIVAVAKKQRLQVVSSLWK